MPPTAARKLQEYAWLRQFWDAVRERLAIAGGTPESTRWPPSTHVWDSGTITAIADNGDGTVTFSDATKDWIDGGGVKRWLVGGGTLYDGLVLPDFAPGQYKLVVFPPDDPNASNLGDPNLGGVFSITDNADTSVTLIDGGRLTLNGQTLSDYVGFKYQIIRDGTGAVHKGYGFPHRYPPRPNENEVDYGTVTSSTPSTVTDDRDGSSDAWKTPKNWTEATLKDAHGNWREIILSVGGRWKRLPVTGISGTDGNTLTVPAQSVAPGGEYWIVDAGSWWRPEFRLRLERRAGRTGNFWAQVNGGVPWHGSANGPRWSPLSLWYSGYTDEARLTHDPAADVIGAAPYYVEQIQIPADPDPILLTVFDVDAVTSADFDPIDYSDGMYSPWFYWSPHALQLVLRHLVLSAEWVEPREDGYDGEGSIPAFTRASWQLYHNPDNARTDVITEVNSGAAAIEIDMPIATPQQGAYASLPCCFEVIADDGSTKRAGTGTVTADTLTPTGTVFDETDEGLGVIIAFDETRRYERRVKYLYPRTVFIPDVKDEEDGGGLAIPPDADYPGSYLTNEASNTYAEYSTYGRLEETGPAFVTGEAARYVADNLSDPTMGLENDDDGLAAYYDLAYQGIPAINSSFPRWEGGRRTGTATGGGTFYLEDASQQWWVGAGPLVTHAGTATGGGGTTLIDTTKATDGFWTSEGGTRFVGHILEVEAAPGTWERRPITAMSGTTLTVVNAFSVATSGKRYRICEPGYGDGRGAILNLWKGRTLLVTRAGVVNRVAITHSDDTRVYFAAGTVTVAAGDTYEIVQWEPGIVVHRRPGHARAVNGWVLPEDAVQDTRGQAWHTGEDGPLENCPTLVTNFGLSRRGDKPLRHLWRELFTGLDALRWIVKDGAWVSRADPEVAENNYRRTVTDASTHATIADAQAGYNHTDADPDSDYYNPREKSIGLFPHAESSGRNDDIDYRFSTAYAYPKVSVPPVMASAVDYYADVEMPDYSVIEATYPATIYQTFDANGAGVTLGWIKFDTDGASTSPERIGDALGGTSLAMPAAPADVGPEYPDGPFFFSYKGWRATAPPRAVIRFDVPGGLTYVTPAT